MEKAFKQGIAGIMKKEEFRRITRPLFPAHQGRGD
jgi:hypothetical protein